MATPTLNRAPVRPARRAGGAGSRIVGVLVSLMLVGLVVALIAPVVAGWRVVTEGHADDRRATDAIVVLGAAQYNGRPSPVLRARLRHAQQLYADDVSRRIVTVGGKQPGDRFTEAEAGVRYLVAQGVPANDITPVGTGRDTVQSLTAVARLADREGWRSVTLVSDPAHMARVEAIGRQLGFRTRLSATRNGDGTALTAGYVARETAGLLAFQAVQRWQTPRIVGR